MRQLQTSTLTLAAVILAAPAGFATKSSSKTSKRIHQPTEVTRIYHRCGADTQSERTVHVDSLGELVARDPPAQWQQAQTIVVAEGDISRVPQVLKDRVVPPLAGETPLPLATVLALHQHAKKHARRQNFVFAQLAGQLCNVLIEQAAGARGRGSYLSKLARSIASLQNSFLMPTRNLDRLLAEFLPKWRKAYDDPLYRTWLDLIEYLAGKREALPALLARGLSDQLYVASVDRLVSSRAAAVLGVFGRQAVGAGRLETYAGRWSIPEQGSHDPHRWIINPKEIGAQPEIEAIGLSSAQRLNLMGLINDNNVPNLVPVVVSYEGWPTFAYSTLRRIEVGEQYLVRYQQNEEMGDHRQLTTARND